MIENTQDLTLAFKPVDISITSTMIAIATSAILAHFLRIIYRNFSRSLSNKDYFSDIFVLLAVATTLVITVVKFSLALSLGLVGALSIVRFRAAIKEPEELVYLFLVIGVGIATGAGQHIVAILVVLSVAIIMVVYRYIDNRKDTIALSEKVSIPGVNTIRLTVSGGCDQEAVASALTLIEGSSKTAQLVHFSVSKEKTDYVILFRPKDNISIESLTSMINGIKTDCLSLSMDSVKGVAE